MRTRGNAASTAVLVAVVPTIALLAIIATARLGGEDSSASVPRADEVVIENFAYTPKSLRVAAGSTIRVRNVDDAAHTLTADDGAFDTGDLGGGDTRMLPLAAPGRYAYHCTIHDYMRGTIVVDG